MSGIKQCGFCSLLSELVRRAMCVGSRRGSSESYYRELGDRDTLKIDDKSSQRSCDSEELHVTFPPCDNNDQDESSVARVSIEEAGDVGRRHLTGRFLTMHRRRRRRLLTRSLCQEEGLLDDLLLGQVQCILNQSAQWPFNAFTLDNVSGGRCLPVLCVHLFHMYGLISHFKLDAARVWKLFSLIEEGYHTSNPYHNSVHAADVTQAMHCFLQQTKIRENMSPLEVMASLLAAIAHDMDHPGVNQPFLIATSNHLAALYKNTSVLENHHWRCAVSCIAESGVLEPMSEHRDQLERQISSLILATDITRQQEYLTNFKNYLDTNTLDLRRADHRHLVLQIALKCADISNPCRPWEISRKWSLKVCEEFFRQGDCERRLRLPLTALCDRRTTSIPKIQTGFFKFVVTPLITEWHRFLKNDLSAQMLENLVYNQNKWEMLVAQEVAEEARAEVCDAEVVDEEVDAGNDSSELLLPPARRHPAIKHHLRRFSAPLNALNEARIKRVGAASSDRPLLPDSSIASVSGAAHAPRHGAAWRLVRQHTFPPLEGSVSNDECLYWGGMRFELAPLEGGGEAEGRGAQLRDNLTAVRLGAAGSDLLNRRRKSMPADSAALAMKDKRVRDPVPEGVRRAGSRRRGSAPAPEGGRRRGAGGAHCTNWVPRRSSLPVEVLRPTDSIKKPE